MTIMTFYFTNGKNKSISLDDDAQVNRILGSLRDGNNASLQLRNRNLLVVAANVTFVETE